jgi:hypothetical protein
LLYSIFKLDYACFNFEGIAMNKSTLLKISYLWVAVFGLSNLVFAESVQLKCPSTEQLSKYVGDSSDDIPFSFNQQTQAIQFNVSMYEPEPQDEDDPWNWRDGTWDLILMNLPVLKGEDVTTVVKQTIEKLQLVSPEPFITSVGVYNGTDSTCVYTLPGNPNLSVFATNYRFSDAESAKAYLKKKKSLAFRFAKQKEI